MGVAVSAPCIHSKHKTSASTLEVTGVASFAWGFYLPLGKGHTQPLASMHLTCELPSPKAASLT